MPSQAHRLHLQRKDTAGAVLVDFPLSRPLGAGIHLRKEEWQRGLWWECIDMGGIKGRSSFPRRRAPSPCHLHFRKLLLQLLVALLLAFPGLFTSRDILLLIALHLEEGFSCLYWSDSHISTLSNDFLKVMLELGQSCLICVGCKSVWIWISKKLKNEA